MFFMAKIVVFGDINFSAVYVKIDGGKEITISGKYPRSITVTPGNHRIEVTTLSKAERASLKLNDGSAFSTAAAASIVNSGSSISGTLSFDSDDVLLIQTELKGTKTKLYNKLVSSKEANDYVDMSKVVDFAERAPGEKNKWVVFLLCFFLGCFGVHRFYEKKIVSGIFYLLTLGVFGFGVLVDLVSILKRKA